MNSRADFLSGFEDDESGSGVEQMPLEQNIVDQFRRDISMNASGVISVNEDFDTGEQRLEEVSSETEEIMQIQSITKNRLELSQMIDIYKWYKQMIIKHAREQGLESCETLEDLKNQFREIFENMKKEFSNENNIIFEIKDIMKELSEREVELKRELTELKKRRKKLKTKKNTLNNLPTNLLRLLDIDFEEQDDPNNQNYIRFTYKNNQFVLKFDEEESVLTLNNMEGYSADDIHVIGKIISSQLCIDFNAANDGDDNPETLQIAWTLTDINSEENSKELEEIDAELEKICKKLNNTTLELDKVSKELFKIKTQLFTQCATIEYTHQQLKIIGSKIPKIISDFQKIEQAIKYINRVKFQTFLQYLQAECKISKATITWTFDEPNSQNGPTAIIKEGKGQYKYAISYLIKADILEIRTLNKIGTKIQPAILKAISLILKKQYHSNTANEEDLTDAIYWQISKEEFIEIMDTLIAEESQIFKEPDDSGEHTTNDSEEQKALPPTPEEETN
jgi:DNA repair exonuclease SbcCD ATPase subunit